MSYRSNRWQRAAKVVLVLALWTPAVVLGARYATGQTPSFVGFDMSSKATAARFTFNSPGLGLPANPTGEVNGAHSEATLASGPAAYGLGSILWPGQVVAALPSFIQSMIEEQAGEDFPFDIPNYPVRAETFFPQGPLTSDLQLGTMLMRSTARETFSEAQAHINSLTFPAIGGVGAQTSFVSNGFDRDGAVVTAESAAGNVSIMGGAVRIDSVVSRAVARSNGTEGEVSGETTIVGAEVAGIPVVIETDGIRVADTEGPGLAVLEAAVNQALDAAGISMSLAPPVDLVDGPRASRTLGGVIVRIDVAPLNDIVSLLPNELQALIRDNAPIDQVITVDLAPLSVSAAATTLGDFGPSVDDEVAAPPQAPPVAAPGPVVPAGPPPQAAPPGPAIRTPGGGMVPAVDFSGVPLWLVLALLAAALVLSRPLVMAADRLFAAKVGSGCPEGRS